MKKYKDKTYQYPPKTFGILIYGLMALLTLNGISSYSQSTINPRDYINYNEVIGKSPTAAQFLRYDELPVSEYTGVPSITIPLYNIEVDNIKVPLTLSYHAGGLKVTQEASWVGLGWDIPAVASVTQIVKDENDLLLYDLYGGKAANDFYPDWRSKMVQADTVLISGKMAGQWVNWTMLLFPKQKSQNNTDIWFPQQAGLSSMNGTCRNMKN